MTEFKGFRLGDVLYIKSSKKAIHKNNITNFKGVHPYVTRTSRNNGIDSLIDYDTEFLNEGNTISLGLDTYVINYQVRPYFTGNKVKILENANLNKYNSIYLITTLDKVFQPYSWGTGIDLKVLSDLVITLPVKSLTDTEPDWDYMEQYIKQIEKKAITLIKEQNEKDIVLLKELVGQEQGSDISDDVEFREFKMSDIFDTFVVGKQPNIENRFQEQSEGMFPVITGVTVDNGTGFYSYKGSFTTYNNLITISKDGEYAGTPFYQNRAVVLGGHSLGCVSANLNKYTSLYIMTELETYQKEGYWKQGGVMGSVPLKRLLNTEISLPVNKKVSEIVPDWITIEEYMKHIQQKYILLKQQENEEELTNLLTVTGLTHDLLALDSKDLVLDQILETLISWNYMESKVARIELDLKLKLAEKLNLMVA